MLRGQDIVLLLLLVGNDPAGSTRALADELDLDVAGIHRALRRLADAGLYDTDRRRVPEAPAEEFLLHAVKYLFPARRGSETRGVPTAWATAPLAREVADTGLPPVWPYADGDVRGIALEPLHAVAPRVALRNPALGARLALVDALRAGDARIRRLAEDALLADLRATA